MPEISQISELGVVGLALLVVLVMIDLIRKKLLGKDGNGKPMVIDCPNKVEGLSATLVALSEESREQTRLNTEQLKVLTRNHEGIARLVDQHKPDSNGREMWKWTTRSEQIQEESRDLLREIVQAVKQRNGASRKP